MRAGYKETVLGEIPVGWDLVSVKEATSDHKQGYYTKEEYTSDGIRLVRITDLKNPRVDFSDMPCLQISDKEYEDFKIELGDFLFARSGAIGRYGIVEKEEYPAVFASYLIKFKFDNTKLINRFFGYFYESGLCSIQLKAITQGNANVNINAENIKSLKLPLPPRLEQQKIADILSTVDEKIEVIDTRISQTEELKKGLMQQLLTKGIGHTKFKESELGKIPVIWEMVKLGTLVEKVGSGITPKGGHESYVKEGVLFIRSQNVLHGKLKLSDVAFISNEQHEKMQGSKLVTGDVLLNITGASIGRSCVVPDNIVEGNVNQHVCIIRAKDVLSNSFLCQFLNSNYGQNQIDKFQAGGNREGLNFQQIRSFYIPFPKIAEQRKIAEILKTVDEKMEVLQAKKENFEELKKGLMQTLLTGKVRVKLN